MSDYKAARGEFGVSAPETLREMHRDCSHLWRLDPEGTSDTKLIELVMEAMYRAKESGQNPQPKANQ